MDLVDPGAVSPHTAHLLSDDGRHQEQMWVAAFASHAARAIVQRGAAPAVFCLNDPMCRLPANHPVREHPPNLGPLCVLCALDSALDRYAPTVGTRDADAQRAAYRVAKIAAAEYALGDLGTDCHDTERTVATLHRLAATLRRAPTDLSTTNPEGQP